MPLGHADPPELQGPERHQVSGGIFPEFPFAHRPYTYDLSRVRVEVEALTLSPVPSALSTDSGASEPQKMDKGETSLRG